MFVGVLIIFFVRPNVNNTPAVSVFELCDVTPMLSRQFKPPMCLVFRPSKTMEIETLEGLSSDFVDEFFQGVLYVSVNFIFAEQFLNVLVNLNVVK